MKRSLVCAAVLAAAFLSLPVPAEAHGGSFRGPPDQVPPGLQEPHDPTPPAPPPPTEAPETPSPVTPTPGVPTPPTPNAPPVQTPTPTPEFGGARPNTGRTRQLDYDSWMFWYEHNKDDIELLKPRLYELTSTENPVWGSGELAGGSRGSRTRATEKATREAIVPTLLWAMDPKNAKHLDIESAAYLALAKVAETPDQIQKIETGLDLRRDHSRIVMESAALALGLLAREDPADQFSARELDRVREMLFGVLENDAYPTRVRSFAMYGLGLLGGQPTGSGAYAGDRQAAERATTTRLFSLLGAGYVEDDLLVGILTAIGLQPPVSMQADQRAVLADCALKGRLHGEKASAIVRSDAALTLGRIGTDVDRKTLETVLTSRRVRDVNIKRSAAIGLGLLGRHVGGEDRAQVAKTLLRGIDRNSDNCIRNFSLISLAYLLSYDVQAGSTEVFDATRADETLIDIASDGTYTMRPFGALACGLVARHVTVENELDVHQTFREAAMEAVREGLEATSMDKRSQAAFCVAAGIAKDSESRGALRAFVADGKEDKQLRGYAAIGLGLIGNQPPSIVQAIADAMLERSSEDLRRQTAVALGMLRNPIIPSLGKDAVELLHQELLSARSQAHKGQVVMALARVGDDRAVAMLVDLVRDRAGEQDLTRALACAGLGIIGDLERVPTLARLSKHVNYRASTDSRNEVLSIL